MAAHLAQPLTITETAVSSVRGGRYVWSVSATFGGGTVALQSLNPDGSTYFEVASRTTAGGTEVLVGEVATLRLSIVTATGVQSKLSMVEG